MAKNDDILYQFRTNQEKETVDMSRKLKIAIIGTGWIAGAHARDYKFLPDVEIVAVADLVPGKAEAFLEKWGMEGVRVYPNHKELLAAEKDLDGVSICTYNSQHAVCTIDALRAGVNVLLEKPMCTSMEEAVAIMRAEKESGKVLTIGFQPRHDPNVVKIREIVESGELGDVYYIQTGGGRRHGIPTPFGTTFIQKDTGVIGATADIGCYTLDMVLQAIGYPKPLTVSGYSSSFFGRNTHYYELDGKPADYADLFGVEDFSAAFIRLEGGIVLDFRIAWAMNMDPMDTYIIGTKGGLKIPANAIGVEPMQLFHEVAGCQVKTEIPVLPQSEHGEFYCKLRSFANAIKSGGPAPVSTSQVIYNQAIINGILESAEKGEEIKITIPEI